MGIVSRQQGLELALWQTHLHLECTVNSRSPGPVLLVSLLPVTFPLMFSVKRWLPRTKNTKARMAGKIIREEKKRQQEKETAEDPADGHRDDRSRAQRTRSNV